MRMIVCMCMFACEEETLTVPAALIMQSRGDMLRYGDDCLPLILCHVLLFGAKHCCLINHPNQCCCQMPFPNIWERKKTIPGS